MVSRTENVLPFQEGSTGLRRPQEDSVVAVGAGEAVYSP